MENQNFTVPNIPTRKIIFIVLAAVILIEVIWAGTILLKPSVQPQTTAVLPPVERQKETTIALTTPSKSLKPGESFDVAVNMSSSKVTNGADIIINYDPNKLTVQNPGSPLVKGSVYSSYPANRVDVKLGKITVSGISENAAVLADGLFGVVTFKARAAGPTTISIDFKPGSTTDTNVIDSESGEDVLERVENLEVVIQ